MNRSLLVVLSAIALVALSLGPAAANTQIPHVAAGAFVGTAVLERPGAPAGEEGLYSPVSPNCGAALCPPRNATWSFGINNGQGGHYQPPVGSGARIGVGNPQSGSRLNGTVDGGTVTSGPDLSRVDPLLPDTGLIGAYCGASSGNGGSGTLTLTEDVTVNVNPPLIDDNTVSIHVTGVGWAQSAATLIVYDGTVDASNGAAAHGTIVGVVSAIPPLPGSGQSCLDGTATTFTIVGTATAEWHDGAA